jgi:tetratricopeptide (TPR) repeat protein
MNAQFWRRVAGWTTATIILVSPAVAFAEDALAAARDLYAAAAYEDALAALNRLGLTARPEDSRLVEQYRALCLLALGRPDEAERAIEAVVAADPSYHPSENDASPRVRAAFSDVRRRMLPTVAQQKYAEAKSQFDQKNYAAASETFGQVLQLFADPDLAAAASRPPLSDLKTLTAGFRDLSLQAIPPPAPAPPPVAEAAPASRPQAAPRIYTSADTGVVPPMTIRQAFPPFSGRVVRTVDGLVEVLINESGAVASATMRGSLNANYDRQLLNAAANWRYVPAMLDGVPVKFRKVIQVTLAPTP